MGIMKPQKPTHRASLVLDRGRDAKNVWMELGALWPSKNSEGVLTGRLEFVGDVVLHSGTPVSLVISPIKRGDEPAQGNADFPFGDNEPGK